MNSIATLVEKVRFRLSVWKLPRNRVEVRHVRTDRFNILVFANEDVGRLIWLNKSFERAESTFFAQSVKSDDICLDIGGNVGYFSALLASCATGGHVHIFEPIPLNAAMIRTTMLLNGFANATVNQMALSTSDGAVQFSVSHDSAYSSMRSIGTSAEVRSITVRMGKLDTYLIENGIDRVDVVKVDVEGAEDLVLRGGEALFSDPARRPRLVMLELAAANLAPYGVTVAEVISTMAGWSYAAHIVSDDGRALCRYVPDAPSGEYNIFFVPA